MIVLGGKQCEVPGVETVSWIDDPRRVPRIVNVTARTRQTRMIFVHTVHGYRGLLQPGKMADSKLYAWTRSQRARKDASWDYTVSGDGTVACQNDVVTHYSWHCTHPNPFSVGIEMEQQKDGTQYEACVDATCRLTVLLCERLGIQKQTPWDQLPYKKRPCASRIDRLDPGRAGVDCVGVLGHRNVWHYPEGSTVLAPERGLGDPNDYVFERLVSAYGFERFDYTLGEDLAEWRIRQTALGVSADGIPLTKTVGALKEHGYINGIWADGKRSATIG
jgi:hypothetical protein